MTRPTGFYGLDALIQLAGGFDRLVSSGASLATIISVVVGRKWSRKRA